MAKAWSYLHASTLPAPYDVVLCKFPEDLKLGNPLLTPHPALILKTALSEPAFLPEVQVAFGTSNLKLNQRPLDLVVMNNQEMYEAGLHKATRFDLDKIIWLPWASEFFIKPAHHHYHSPVIGHLADNTIRVFGHLLAERARRKAASKKGRDKD